jgi:hypothetical protein
MAWGMVDGILALCFLVHTWNLACQGHNTARIRLSHMSWNPFDATQINFKQTKMDKLGGGKQQKRSVYSNPFECDIYHVFMLALYLATAFMEKQSRGHKLFPGSASSQSSRAVNILKRVLKENKDKVLPMGYDSINNIGLHSTCKGAASYLASLPGGLSPAAICLQGG